MPNNPLPDEQLAELDRLHAAANGHKLRLAPFSGAKIETDSSPTGYVGVCVWRSDAEWFVALHNAYPPLRQRLLAAESRLAEAERERDERTMMAARAQEAMRYLMNGLPTDDAVWSAYGNADSARAWLAARDAQQRREGAAAVWDIVAERSKLVGDAAGETYATDAAKRLREGK